MERHKIPRYARYKGLSTIEHAFLKQDVEKRREQRQVEQQLENTSLESHYENFKYRLKLLKISFGEQTKYTKEKWFTHVFEILHSSHAQKKQ
ncbi:hypothetical protein ACT7DN_09445 [Bacillus paranthracis]